MRWKQDSTAISKHLHKDLIPEICNLSQSTAFTKHFNTKTKRNTAKVDKTLKLNLQRKNEKKGVK